MTEPDDYTASVSGYLTDAEIAIVSRCFLAVLDGPWMHATEIHTRFGLDADEVEAVADAWPRGPGTATQMAAVAGVLREVGLGFRFTDEEWDSWIGRPRDEVMRVHDKIRELQRREILPRRTD